MSRSINFSTIQLSTIQLSTIQQGGAGIFRIRRLKKPGLALAFLALLTACQPPPDFVDVQGNGHTYETLGQQWVVLNYWATWCGPCIKEIPELNKLDAEHDNIVVLGVNWDEPEGEEQLAQLRKMKIEFPVYQASPHERLGIEKPEVLPTTFVFAPGMELVATLVGPQTEEGLLALVNGSGG